MNKELEVAFSRFETCRTIVREKVAHYFPVGTKVQFFIQHGQVNPSSGEVRGHINDQFYGVVLSVLHDQAKPFSRYRFRRVPVSHVITFAKPA